MRSASMDRTLLVLILCLTAILSSCDSSKSIELSNKRKLCLSSKHSVAAISYEENATEVTLSMPAKNFTGNVYVHLNTENMLQGSAFMANLALLIENTEKINMPGLELKSVLDDSVGVYHYFDNNPDISINDYRGSCYTLSDEIGECTFYLLKKEIFVKFDFPYSSLSSWKEILRNTDEQISKLFC